MPPNVEMLKALLRRPLNPRVLAVQKLLPLTHAHKEANLALSLLARSQRPEYNHSIRTFHGTPVPYKGIPLPKHTTTQSVFTTPVRKAASSYAEAHHRGLSDAPNTNQRVFDLMLMSKGKDPLQPKGILTRGPEEPAHHQQFLHGGRRNDEKRYPVYIHNQPDQAVPTVSREGQLRYALSKISTPPKDSITTKPLPVRHQDGRPVFGDYDTSERVHNPIPTNAEGHATPEARTFRALEILHDEFQMRKNLVDSLNSLKNKPPGSVMRIALDEADPGSLMTKEDIQEHLNAVRYRHDYNGQMRLLPHQKHWNPDLPKDLTLSKLVEALRESRRQQSFNPFFSLTPYGTQGNIMSWYGDGGF